MTIFISYARKDRAAAKLRHDLKQARVPVARRRLTGGQAWWETILGDPIVRAFRVRAGPRLLRSKACQAELRYALST